MILPILLALVVGIVELGRAWNVRQVLVNGAREGARVFVLPDKVEADARAEVESRLTDAGLDPALATIDITGTEATGNHVSVSVDYPYQFLFLGPVVDLLPGDDGSIPGSITLSTTTTMRHE